MDGASNAWGFGIRIVLESPGVIRVEHLLRLGFQASNNEAKYEAFAVKLRVAVKVGATNIKIYSDSYLVVSQVKRGFRSMRPKKGRLLETSSLIASTVWVGEGDPNL